MSKQILFDDSARIRILAGVDALAVHQRLKRFVGLLGIEQQSLGTARRVSRHAALAVQQTGGLEFVGGAGHQMFEQVENLPLMREDRSAGDL